MYSAHVYRFSTNRTILELKCVYFVFSPTAGTATNRTILELKCNSFADEANNDRHYQSHHTGIEIEVLAIQDLSCLLPIAPYWNWNRHWTTSNRLSDTYQSHHTGIEMKQRWSLKCQCRTTNRTILELKLIEINEIKPTRTYQSHHTGIEMKEHRF